MDGRDAVHELQLSRDTGQMEDAPASVAESDSARTLKVAAEGLRTDEDFIPSYVL